MEQVICQSCGMPMSKPEDFGNNADGSQNNEYCTYCYQGGEFTFKGTLPEMIEKQVSIAKEKMGMSEETARKMASETLPKLSRWLR